MRQKERNLFEKTIVYIETGGTTQPHTRIEQLISMDYSKHIHQKTARVQGKTKSSNRLFLWLLLLNIFLPSFFSFPIYEYVHTYLYTIIFCLYLLFWFIYESYK